MITPGHSTEERGDNQCKYNGSKSPAGEKGRLHRIPRRDGIKKSPAGGTFFLAQRKDPAHKYFRVDIHLLDYDFDLVFVLVCVVTIFTTCDMYFKPNLVKKYNMPKFEYIMWFSRMSG